MATLFRSGQTEDAASIPGSRNVASADIVGTGREVGESRPEACRTACRVVCGREERTGGTVHCENARACTSGEIGRGEKRTWGGSTEGDRRTAGRSAMAGQSRSESRKCCHDAIERLSEDAVRNELGLSGPGENRTEETDTDSARRSVLLAPESSGRRRACMVIVFHTSRPTATSRRDGRPRGSVGRVGGKTSEGINPRGVIGAKQSRTGFGRSNASGG